MTPKQFEWTTTLVWAVLDPWLKLQFGEKCSDYEHGCECCQRWKLAEELLAYDRIGTPENLQQEIKTLEECLKWRKEMLQGLTTYGNCPQCGSPGVQRERRLNGNDTCKNGHVYPSKMAKHDMTIKN